MSKIFVVKSDECMQGRALVCSAMSSGPDMLEFLSENSSQDSIEQAILEAASAPRFGAVKTMMQRCDQDSLPSICVRAVMRGLVELVKLLIDKVNVQTVDTSLRIAATQGNAEVVKVLLDASTSSMISSAIDFAETSGHAEAVNLLRKRVGVTETMTQDGVTSVAPTTPSKRARLK
ncbi:hypothetical protein JG688_00009112 [Phytophthora aleatoria]|uniref:Ankyrin repeat protein n=1 Tax=Phytophthora aleatoria TaxID=2496075 RepID=A0A8J5M2L5_9STRA|nr:hypothetical protein JG688_00009112 [Phytophthora aleatoria]